MRSVGRSAALAGALTLLVSGRAFAPFHIAVIDEVMSGFCGDDSIQYVEVRMLASGQTFVSGTRLKAFSCDGTQVTPLLTVPSNVTNGTTDGRWIMATASFALGTHIRTTLDGSNASAVLDAVAALGGTRAGAKVTFTAPLDGLRCTAPFNLTVVPKIAHGKPRKGVRVLRSRTATATKADRDTLRLVCIP